MTIQNAAEEKVSKKFILDSVHILDTLGWKIMNILYEMRFYTTLFFFDYSEYTSLNCKAKQRDAKNKRHENRKKKPNQKQ